MTDTFARPGSGGPVKRNDEEYRWVTDKIKHEVREIVEYPPVPAEPEDKVKVSNQAGNDCFTSCPNAFSSCFDAGTYLKTKRGAQMQKTKCCPFALFVCLRSFVVVVVVLNLKILTQNENILGIF